MKFKKLLIANRGEIAVRIARAAAELDIAVVAIYSADDSQSLHRFRADEAVQLEGAGVSAYLNIEQIIRIARDHGCDAVHPGYGFLSENADFAQACDQAGLAFIGPDADVLRLFGDKAAARALAGKTGVPVVAGTEEATSLEDAHAFFDGLGAGGAMMVKAISGGGGRGMRAVHRREDIDAAYQQCESEALTAFGTGALYVEQLITSARHIEIQIIGDGTGAVSHLWDRECTIQRRNQKALEIAPSPSLDEAVRTAMTEAAVTMARHVKYRGLGTFEFLLATDSNRFMFMEANPRVQVEHTVTEEITGVDLIVAQIRVAAGMTLADIGLVQDDIRPPVGYAVQLRINTETMMPDGTARPAAGTIRAFDPPSGPGVRVDTHGYAGYRNSPSFDSLLAKVIVSDRAGDFPAVIRKAYRALCEFRIEGVRTNIPFLQNLLLHPAVIANEVTTRFVDEHIGALIDAGQVHQQLFADAGNDEDSSDVAAGIVAPVPAGLLATRAPMHGTVVSIDVQDGDTVYEGQPVATIEAMKMQYGVNASASGIVRGIRAAAGRLVEADEPLILIEPAEVDLQAQAERQDLDPDYVRPDLAEVLRCQAQLLDEQRPDAVARRRRQNGRTARENVADLFGGDDYIEYGGLTYAAQQKRYSVDELRQISPADGFITSIGHVNRALFPKQDTRCVAMAYDYTVFAGTQGTMNHRKIDRVLEVAERWRLPIVLFAEGGGGRPGDLENHAVALLHTKTFLDFARLSGLVPRVSIVNGRCFAGNAALAGCSDIIIATKNATIGMGGPAMVEGGGLGSYKPEEIGPVSVQAPNGVFDLVVADEAQAVAAARKYMAYFQGPVTDWDCADQRALRSLVPENRVRAYDIRTVIQTVADTDSVLELREQFGVGIITALVRIEGRPMGLIANNPAHLGGAIDADAADKAARFMQLCDAFDLPILSLCDTPGFMVGPEAEKTAMVRHVSRMFVVAASMSVPLFTVVLRKGYGLGAISMAGGSFHGTAFTVSWPSGEFGAMGIEGAVRLGYRKELEAVADQAQRDELFQRKVDEAYEHGKALNMAAFLEIDNVIDPATTRDTIVRGLDAVLTDRPHRDGKKRPCIDTW